jgi:hypothetical protein
VARKSAHADWDSCFPTTRFRASALHLEVIARTISISSAQRQTSRDPRRQKPFEDRGKSNIRQIEIASEKLQGSFATLHIRQTIHSRDITKSQSTRHKDHRPCSGAIGQLRGYDQASESDGASAAAIRMRILSCLAFLAFWTLARQAAFLAGEVD